MLTIPSAHAPFRHRVVVGSSAWTETVKSSYAGLIDFEAPEANPIGPELFSKLESAYLNSHPLPEMPKMPDFAFSVARQWEDELEAHLDQRSRLVERHESAVSRIRDAAVEFAQHGVAVVNWLRGRR